MPAFTFKSTARVREMRDLLLRLLAWDHFESAADGPYWVGEINKALGDAEEELEDRHQQDESEMSIECQGVQWTNRARRHIWTLLDRVQEAEKLAASYEEGRQHAAEAALCNEEKEALRGALATLHCAVMLQGASWDLLPKGTTHEGILSVAMLVAEKAMPALAGPTEAAPT